MQPEYDPNSKEDQVTINVIDLFEEEFDLEIKLQCGEIINPNIKPAVILVVECGSGLDLEATKSLKLNILKFIGDLRINEVKKIFLAWNDKSYELTERPFAEIKEIIEVQNSSVAKVEFSYRQTL